MYFQPSMFDAAHGQRTWAACQRQAAGEGREMNARALHVRNPTSIGIEAGPRTDGDAAIGHDEWLVDEAILGSFPASDPASSAQPGSIVNERYADASLEERD